MTVTITGTNDAAVLSTATVNLTETNAVLTTGGQLTISDLDAGQSTFVAQAGTAGTHGTFAVNAAGAWTYTTSSAHNEFAAGTTYTDTFSVASADGTLTSVTVNILGANDAATFSGTDTGAVTEASGVANGIPGTPTASGILTVNDVDSAATVVLQNNVATTYGHFTIGSGGGWSYTLDNNNGAVQALNTSSAQLHDLITVTTADGTTHQVNVAINGANDAAVISGTTTGTVVEAGSANGGGTPVASATLTDSDVDNTPNTFTPSSGSASHGSYSMTAGGLWTYTLNAADTAVNALNTGEGLTDTFTITTLDGTQQVINIVIEGADDNQAPTAVADTASATEAGGTNNGTAGVNPTGNVLANDTDPDAGDTKAVTAVNGSGANVNHDLVGAHGTLHLNSNGTYTYTVDNADTAVNALASSAQTVTDSFTYTMADGAGATSSSSLTVTIHGANDAPVAVADTASATEASGLNNATAGVNPSGNVLTNDTDVDTGDTRTVSAVGGVPGNVGADVTGSHGTLHLNGDGTYTYAVNNADTAVNALNVGGTLTDTFTYTVKDAGGLTSNSSLTVTIHGADDSPTGFDFTLAAGGATVDNGSSLNAGGLIGTFNALGDPDGGSVTFDPLSGANASLFSFNQATGALSVGGANISAGTYTATVTAHEGANVFQQTVKVWVAGAGPDNLSGSGTDIDIMYGQNGNDTLAGNGGSDALIGGANNDTITGGAGNDQLVGGNNNDKFVFNLASEGLDHIFDFGAAGTDEIDFHHLAFGNLATGNTATGTLDVSHFASNVSGTATAATAQFVYNTTTSILYYDADGTGAGAAIAMAKLENAFALQNTDIHLI